MAITRFGDVSADFLEKWLVWVAGESDQDDVNSSSLQLFTREDFGEGWSIQLSDMDFNHDVERSRWNSLQLGAHLDKLVQIDSLPVRMSVEYDHGFQVPLL